MAVHRGLRGFHVGQAILQTLVNAARQRGDSEVMLHAQRSAEGFYLRQGFVARGEPFEEAGIAHIEMARVASDASGIELRRLLNRARGVLLRLADPDRVELQGLIKLAEAAIDKADQDAARPLQAEIENLVHYAEEA